MAGIKISALPAIPSSQLTDIAPFTQASVTYKATNSQLVTLFNTNIQLASTAQVTGLNAQLATFLPLAGGTMTGNLILNANPTVAFQAATKAYVDTVASGFTVILACWLATTANLNATPAGAGVGATLTNAGAMVALTIDGVATVVGDRILVKNQTLTQHNGVYTVTDIGSGATNWILTRATDYDTNTEIVPGTLVAVNNGTVNANTSWLETATVVTVDTDPVLFSQFTFAPASFLMVANNLSDVANAATSRTNLGLGSVATKTASDASKTNVAMVNGATTIGHAATFSDVNGTITDGGPLGSVTSVATAGLATGGPITTTGTITVTAAIKSDQITGTSTTVTVVPGVQQYHPSAAKAWIRFAGNPISIKSSYNVTSAVRNSIGNYTITYTTAFTTPTSYCAVGTCSANASNATGVAILGFTAATTTFLTDSGGALVDPTDITIIAFGTQ